MNPGDVSTPEHIRATLSFAGLYQITHELLKSVVLDGVREFYGVDGPAHANPFGRPRYQAEVLSLDPQSHFRASLLWLVHAKAISEEQANRLDEIYGRRNQVIRELLTHVVDPAFQPDLDLFKDALRILTDIHRFWTQIAIDKGEFTQFGEVTVDDVKPPWGWAFWSCIDALSEPTSRDGDQGATEAG
jgi:hypothetical protein